jgi:hypothetical protein
MAIKRPPADIPGYMELRKQFDGDARPSGHPAEPEQAPSPKPAPRAPLGPAPSERRPWSEAAPTDPPRAPSAAAPRSAAPDPAAAVMIKGSAAVPVQGHDAIFDAAVEAYGEVEAVRIIVDRGLSSYVEAVRAGRVRGLAPAYPRRSRSVQLARVMPADVIETIGAWADPLGILKPSKAAGVILSQIIAWQIGRKG